MAKYSRSDLSMKQALEELTQQKTEQFLNTFYFQYGHRSIADLAHLSFAIENVSMLAAIAIVDESRWDGQERSSRYQDFRQSGFVVPTLPQELEEEFKKTAENLFEEYERLSEASGKYLAESTPKSSEMSEASYKRAIRARAFDIARYLLPLATRTSVGQIVSARTLENQISRLAVDPHGEVRHIAVLLRESAASEPYNLRLEQLKKALLKLQARHPEVTEGELLEMLSNPPVAPTLVKYSAARSYDHSTHKELTAVAESLLHGVEAECSQSVSLVKPETLDIELAATLLYERSHHSYKQIVDLVSGLPPKDRQEIIELGVKHRGPYDEVSRPYESGYEFQFDILTDLGAFRDLHRHRRCIQILQAYTSEHGYETPAQVESTGFAERYRTQMNECRQLWQKIGNNNDETIRESRDYVLPLAFRRRSLFKMDLAEVIYICELRTGPGGHFSYRRIASEMHARVKQRYPTVAVHMRVHDVDQQADLLKR
jgi:thymidylate synthase ThyX